MIERERKKLLNGQKKRKRSFKEKHLHRKQNFSLFTQSFRVDRMEKAREMI